LTIGVVEDNLLIHELQLGEQLGKCVHSQRRSDFSLMLAMLTQDVREHSQFFVPQTENIQPEVDDAALRKSFNLPDKPALSIRTNEEIPRFNQAELIQDNRLNELHLLNALRPSPIGFRDDKNHITSDVMANTSLYCQTQHQAKQQNQASDELINKRLSFDAKGWITSIQAAMVQHTALQA
jgi:hypothetical protein